MVAVGIYAPEVDSRSFAILEQKRQKYPFLIFRNCQFAAFGAKNYVLEISGVTHKTKVLLIVLHTKYMLIYFSGGAHAAQSVVHQSPNDVGGVTESVTAHAVKSATSRPEWRCWSAAQSWSIIQSRGAGPQRGPVFS